MTSTSGRVAPLIDFKIEPMPSEVFDSVDPHSVVINAYTYSARFGTGPHHAGVAAQRDRTLVFIPFWSETEPRCSENIPRGDWTETAKLMSAISSSC